MWIPLRFRFVEAAALELGSGDALRRDGPEGGAPNLFIDLRVGASCVLQRRDF